MEPKLVEKITREIQRRYPEFAGCQPKVRRQSAPDSAASEIYLLTYLYKPQVDSSQGIRALTRSLRVVADANGKIIKVSTSK